MARLSQNNLPLIDDFINYILKEKRYSNNTALAYKKDLSQFYSFIKLEYDITNLLKVSRPIIKTWLAQLSNEEQDARTVRRKLSTLKSFYKYCQRLMKIKQNPTTGVSTPKISKKLPKFVEEISILELLEKLKQQLDQDSTRWVQYIILKLFYVSGIRVSELANLKLKNFDFSLQQLKVQGKGNKERLIPLSEEFCEELKNYLSLIKISENHPSIFLRKNGLPLYIKAIYTIIKNVLQNCTTLGQKSPHILRHSFATHLLNGGAEINAVKDLLGHSSLAATQVYAHNTIDKLKAIYRQAHPRS